jgi:tyrosyl-tRNA synthetase
MAHPTSIDAQISMIQRGAVDLITIAELRRKLERSTTTGKPLRVKLGLDPTAPDIHLGHAVVLHKLRQFQELGHHVILVIGDFTGMIGDPTGKSETRRPLTRDDILANAQTYATQIYKVLDPALATVRFNSEWLGQLTPEEIVTLAAKHTVARMLERDDFQRRFHEGRAISVHEFLYPLFQGLCRRKIFAAIKDGYIITVPTKSQQGDVNEACYSWNPGHGLDRCFADCFCSRLVGQDVRPGDAGQRRDEGFSDAEA